MRALSFVVLACVIAAGCQTPTLPSGSWIRPTGLPGLTTPTVQPSAPAALEIRNAVAMARRVSLTSSQYQFVYTLRFDVVETAGESGAMILSIHTSTGDEFHDVVDGDCWGAGIRVGAGNFLRIDEALDYCAPFARSRAEVSGVSVDVSFVDDRGRAGRVQAVAPVSR